MMIRIDNGTPDKSPASPHIPMASSTGAAVARPEFSIAADPSFGMQLMSAMASHHSTSPSMRYRMLIESPAMSTDWRQFEKDLQATLQASKMRTIVLLNGSDEDGPPQLDLNGTCHIEKVYAAFNGTIHSAIEEALQRDGHTLFIPAPNETVDPLAKSEDRSQLLTKKSLRKLPSRVDSDTARADRSAIWNKGFRREVRHWIAQYDEVGHRDLYLWQWCLHGIELTTLPSVSEEWQAAVHDVKLLSVILCVLFDDVSDREHDSAWLERLIAIADGAGVDINVDDDSAIDSNQQKHLAVTRSLWTDYESRLRALPRFCEFSHVWKFDIQQFLSAMRYSHLVNANPGMINPTEHDVYTPHNMMMVSFGTIDFMASDEIPIDERGAIRETLWHVQAMGRVGNVLSTWRREINEGDFSSGMIARAVSDGIIDDETISQCDHKEIVSKLREANYDQVLKEKWERHRRVAHRAAQQVISMDLAPVLKGHDRFLEMHLGSTGLI